MSTIAGFLSRSFQLDQGEGDYIESSFARAREDNGTGIDCSKAVWIVGVTGGTSRS